jgi:hypothetical protein
VQSKPLSAAASEPQLAKEKSIGQRIAVGLQKYAPPPPDSRGKRRNIAPDIHAAR